MKFLDDVVLGAKFAGLTPLMVLSKPEFDAEGKEVPNVFLKKYISACQEAGERYGVKENGFANVPIPVKAGMYAGGVATLYIAIRRSR